MTSFCRSYCSGLLTDHVGHKRLFDAHVALKGTFHSPESQLSCSVQLFQFECALERATAHLSAKLHIPLNGNFDSSTSFAANWSGRGRPEAMV